MEKILNRSNKFNYSQFIIMQHMMQFKIQLQHLGFHECTHCNTIYIIRIHLIGELYITNDGRVNLVTQQYLSQYHDINFQYCPASCTVYTYVHTCT